MTKRKMLKGGSLSPDVIQGLLKKSYEKQPSSFNDYQIDKSLSGERVQVYYNPALKQAVVVHRGSAGAKDWLVNDAGLMVGYRGNRFSHAQDIQNKAEKKYGAKNVTTLGHSLGAKVAEEVGQNSKEIITLNKPTVDAKPVSSKQYDIRASSDVVSGLSGIASSNNKTTIPSGYRNPYSEHSTDVLSRLDDKKIGRGRYEDMIYSATGEIKEHVRTTLRSLSYYTPGDPRVLRILRQMIPFLKRRAKDLGDENIFSYEMERIEEEIQKITGEPRGGKKLRGGMVQEAAQPTHDELLQERDRLAGLYNQALASTAGDITILEFLENLHGVIDALEAAYDTYGIFNDLSSEIFETRLSLEEDIEAAQVEYDGETDTEGGGLIGGGSIQPTPAQMLQRLVNRHYAIQQIADLEERHEALFQQWERYTDYAQTLNANDAEQFFDLLDEYGEELADLGEEIDQQQGQLAIQNPDNMEGGARRFRISDAALARRDADRLYNTLWDRSNAIVTSREPISSDGFFRRIESLRAIANTARSNGERLDDQQFYQLANWIDEQIQGLYDRNSGAMEDVVIDVTNRNARNPRRPYQPPDLPPRKRGAGIFRSRHRRVAPDPDALEEEESEEEVVEEGKDDPVVVAQELAEANADLAEYLGLNFEEPEGGGRRDGYSECYDCGCDSYRDFNALHAEGGGTGSSSQVVPESVPVPVATPPLGTNPNELRRQTDANLMRGQRIRKKEWFSKVIIPKFRKLYRRNAALEFLNQSYKKRGESTANLQEEYNKNMTILTQIERTFGLPSTNRETFNSNLDALERLARGLPISEEEEEDEDSTVIHPNQVNDFEFL